MKPGDIEYYDEAYCYSQAAKIKKITHSWFRASFHGLKNLPQKQFLAVGNHSGGTLIPDSLVWLSQYHTGKQSTHLLSLSNPAIFDLYPRVISKSLAKMGAIRADSRIALKALSQGYSLQVYPGGDLDACRTFTNRNKIIFGGNIAYAKLAIKTRTPILPVVAHGGHNGLIILNDGASFARKFNLERRIGLKAFPFSICLPWGIWLGPLPGYIPWRSKIKISVLPAVDPVGTPVQLDLKVRGMMQMELDRLALDKENKE